MKEIWKEDINYNEHQYSVKVISNFTMINIIAVNSNNQPILVKMNDENGNETIVRISGSMDWIMQDDLTYNGQDPNYWLRAMVERIKNTITWAIDHKKNVNF